MAMGRPRSRRREGWPDNLYPNRDGFKYRHPITRKETFMGRDKAKAFAAARKLNAILMPGGDLVSKVVGARETVADAIRVFRDDEVPKRKWSEKTAAEHRITIKRIETGLGARELADLTVKDCATWIRGETESARSRQNLRLVLIWILDCAVEEGWIESNPAAVTRKFAYERQRDRLTTDSYRAIWEKAPHWLRVAMDLSLLTLLRREDIAGMRFADVRDGALWVVPTKTEGSTGVRLKIAISDDLAAVLARARDDVVSPFVVHALPGKARPTGMRAKGRTHHTQVLPEQITRAFATARDAAGIDSDTPPTFHEVRSLGGALLQQSGWSLEDVQALMGHASEEMTRVYLEGHEAPWLPVSSGSGLPA